MGRGTAGQTDEAVQLLQPREQAVEAAPAEPAKKPSKKRRKMPEVDFKLYPSKFGFLWDECQRCYWLDVKKKFRRPFQRMPRVFSDIDQGMKDYFVGKRTEQVCPQLPPGEFISGEVYVCSQKQQHGDTSFVLCGKPDAIIRFDDGTYGIVDFKTSGLSAEQLPKYARQLETYARAVESPADDYPKYDVVSHVGLLVFRPSLMNEDGDAGALALRGSLEWNPIDRAEADLDTFLGEVVDLLSSDEMPDAHQDCPYCAYRAQLLQADEPEKSEQSALAAA